ncbi:hypothetical protein Pfeifenkraut_BL3002 [Xanthomonas phage Pfeifenkraut]|uniref:Uncharacterized protein n=1 Tax=Xanthomonas phage Pfeifenkraut TaxID=2939132 RepID=A0A9E7J643_9CAUD|nr:hypothetical protein QAY91_gp02 [Xanthomonas phage Pfeifenkraut]URA06899.1 hypothetical protein Pfeifenkraut_BL3002 [Xanthomonas phage Pfeifenkraut]
MRRFLTLPRISKAGQNAYALRLAFDGFSCRPCGLVECAFQHGNRPQPRTLNRTNRTANLRTAFRIKLRFLQTQYQMKRKCRIVPVLATGS